MKDTGMRKVRYASVAILLLTGCSSQPRRSQLEAVSRAALHIKTAIGIGSYRSENASLDDLAYQIALAKRSNPDSPDLQAIAYYERALHFYLSANELQKVGHEFRRCEIEYYERFGRDGAADCMIRHGEDVRNAAVMAEIPIDQVTSMGPGPDSFVRRAFDEIDKAEKARATLNYARKKQPGTPA